MEYINNINLMNVILRSTNFGIIIFDKDKNIIFNNLNNYFNIFKKEFDHEDYINFLDKFTKNISEEFLRSNLEDLEYEFNFKLKSNKEIWIKYNIKKEFNLEEKKEFIIINFYDITDCKNKEIQYKLKSQIDFLTGVYNRNYFEEKFDIEIQRCTRSEKPLSIIMIDLDNFKFINDYYGHNIGDIVLKEIAYIIKNSIHRKSDFVARFGGDEFICILPYTNSDGSLVVANRIKNKVKEYNNEKINFEKITLSIGIFTQEPRINIKKEEIIEKVDKALYHSKNCGKDMITIYNDLFKD